MEVDEVSASTEQTTEQPAVTAAPQSKEIPAPPEGYVTIPVSEHENAKRWRENYNGVRPVAETLGRAGIKSRQDAERLARIVNSAKNSGVDLEQLLDSMNRKSPENGVQQTQGVMDAKSIASIVRDVLEQSNQKQASDMATRQHQEFYSRQDDMRDKLVKELVGDITNEDARIEAEALVDRLVEERMEQYPDGHPLRDRVLKPLDEKVFSIVRDRAKSIRKVNRSAQLKTIGNASNSATIAGSQSSEPGSPPNQTRQEVLAQKYSREGMMKRAEAVTKKIIAAQGGVMSSQE